jgi:hypothetical protein
MAPIRSRGPACRQAQVAVRDLARVEALAVVADAQPDAALAAAHARARPGGRGVLDDVVERLLGDPVETSSIGQRQRPSRSVSTTIGRPIRPWSAALWV